MIDYWRIIDKYYKSGSRLREILTCHSTQVAEKALSIAKSRYLDLDPAQIEAAAMLHDIGILYTDAPGIECHGTEPYIRHGILGADLLRREGAPEWLARVAERHTGAGLTADDIVSQRLPLPMDRCLMPQTTLELLVCYADKFFSKSGDMKEKPLERVRLSISKFGRPSIERFEAIHAMFAD